jgi:sodium transport system permease protein
LLGPILIVGLFVFLIGGLESSLGGPKRLPLAVVGPVPDLGGSKEVEVKPVANESEGIRLLRAGKVRLVVSTEPEADGHAVVRAVYDPAETMSRLALAAVEKGVEQSNRRQTLAVLADLGVPESKTTPYRVESRPDRSPEGLGASTIASMLPYLVVLWAFYGVMSSVTDMFAGEKERGTLETLVATPARREDIALGKLLSLFALSLLSSLSTFVAVIGIGLSGLSIAKASFPEPPQVSLLSLAAVLFALVPFAAFCAGLAASVAAPARSSREAQTNLTLVSFVIMLPAVYSQFLGIVGDSGGSWVAWTPVLSTAMAIRNALLDRFDPAMAVPAAIVHLALASVFYGAVVRAFRSDRLLSKQ